MSAACVASHRQPATGSVKWPLLLLAALTSGCGTLAKPPLPKFAIGEAPQDEQWAASIRRADVIYLGLTEMNETQGESVQRIVDALRKDGGRVALGWTEFPAVQQPLLDQWQCREISAQQLLAQLDAPRYGDWMQPAVRPDLTHVALGARRPLLRKIRAGDSLTSEERALLPTDYRPSPEAFDNFVERISTSSRLRRFDVTRLYRAHLAAEQVIAHNVVLFTHSNPKVKLLVFCLTT